jgi:signal transduction histidine kinase
VPLVTADELGDLAAGFNRMLADLRHQANELSMRERDLRDSRTRIVLAADQARKRVERDLHDGAQQRLVLLNLKLAQLQRTVETDPAIAERVADIRVELASALAELRDLAHGLYPATLESDGLAAALREASQRTALRTQIDSDGTGRYPPEVETAVYFSCLEALQNAAKHAGEHATITIRIAEHDKTLTFEVADDGAGFEVDSRRSSHGIQNMTDRLGALGGTLRVESAPHEGTRIHGSIPLQ